VTGEWSARRATVPSSCAGWQASAATRQSSPRSAASWSGCARLCARAARREVGAACTDSTAPGSSARPAPAERGQMTAEPAAGGAARIRYRPRQSYSPTAWPGAPGRRAGDQFERDDIFRFGRRTGALTSAAVFFPGRSAAEVGTSKSGVLPRPLRRAGAGSIGRSEATPGCRRLRPRGGSSSWRRISSSSGRLAIPAAGRPRPRPLGADRPDRAALVSGRPARPDLLCPRLLVGVCAMLAPSCSQGRCNCGAPLHGRSHVTGPRPVFTEPPPVRSAPGRS
jgi:hypothetical protein